MECVHSRPPGRWPETLQRVATHDRRDLAAHADTHAEGLGTRRTRNSNRLSHHTAACGVPTNRTWTHVAETDPVAREMGAGKSGRDSTGEIFILRKIFPGCPTARKSASGLAPWTCALSS